MGIVRAAAIGLIGLMLAACVAAAPGNVWVHQISPHEAEGVRAVVRPALIDPPSAIFTPMSAVRGDGGTITVCGHVRSKALSGAYTGMRPYRVAIEHDAMRLVSLGSPRGFLRSEVSAQNCQPVAG